MTRSILSVALIFTAAFAGDLKTGRELAASAAEAFQQGRAGDAIERLRRAIKLDPENPVYEAALGQVYLSTGQASLALPLLNRSLRAAPGDLEIRMALAQTYQNLEKDLDALRILGTRPPG